jgi:hypothetical protein
MIPSIGNLIFGFCGIGGGFFVLTRAYYLNHQIYFLAFAERKWGPGSGTLAYRAIGLGLMIFCIFVITGYIDLFPAGASTIQTNNSTSPLPSSNSGPIQIAP